MSSIIDKEISVYKGEIKASEARLVGLQESFKQEMLNGLGEQIKKDLEHPLKPKRTLKQKIRRWLNI